jgi:hypothetical protein
LRGSTWIALEEGENAAVSESLLVCHFHGARLRSSGERIGGESDDHQAHHLAH